MRLEELQRKIKNEVVMQASHDQMIEGLKILYSATLLRADTKQAESIRSQIHDTMDLALDCRSRIAYLGTVDVTD